MRTQVVKWALLVHDITYRGCGMVEGAPDRKPGDPTQVQALTLMTLKTGMDLDSAFQRFLPFLKFYGCSAVNISRSAEDDPVSPTCP